MIRVPVTLLWRMGITAAWRPLNKLLALVSCYCISGYAVCLVGAEGLGEDVGGSGEGRADASQTAIRKGDDHVRLKRIASVEAGVLDAHVTSERR